MACSPFFLSLLPAFLSFVIPFVSLLLLSLCLCCFVFVVAFSLTDYTQKEKGAISCVLSSCVVGLLCKIGFSVLVKLVIISLNVFCYTFVGVRIFVIVPPLFKKTFENTLDKFPCVKFVFYALFYVI